MADKFDLKAIISAVDKITPTLKGIQRSVRLTGKTFKDVGRESRNLMSGLGLPAGLAFGAVAFGAINAARASLEYAGRIQDAADRTGAGIGEYQALVNMLGQVGGGADDADMAFKTFSKGIAAAALGADKGFASLMSQLMVPLRDANGQIRGLMDVLPELADGFARNTNPAIRSRLALELFGKSGLKMIPILAKGRDGVRTWIAEQERLGLIIKEESVSALDDLGDSLSIVSTQIRAQFTTAMAKIVPIIQPVISQITEWIAANKELIQSNFVSAIKGILELDWRGFMADLRSVIDGVRGFVGWMGGVKNVLMAVGAMFLAGPIAAILGIVGALWRFGAGLISIVGGWKAIGGAIMAVWRAVGGLAWLVKLLGVALMKDVVKVFMVLGRVIMANPIGLLITAMVAGAYLVYSNWETIKGWFTDFFNWLPEKIRGIAGWFKDMVPDWAREMFGGGSVTVNQGAASATPLMQSGAIGMAAGRSQLNGSIDVNFNNAPPGMRAAPGKTNQPGVSMNPDVGYRSLALLAP